ncbi:hypothetical protein Sjap_013039 [Stephania japonica]|uniref:Uncharacterized protein n=1 Tax=Stephania japonica TaxID=461633 RepID=A0AAP0IZ50_9MAGN
MNNQYTYDCYPDAQQGEFEIHGVMISCPGSQSLTGNQTLVSKDDKSELGFFTLGNSQNYYISIWFKQVAAV